MPRLIDKNGELIENAWLLLPKDADLATVEAAGPRDLLVPLALWQSDKEALRTADRRVAVWLDSDEQADALASDLDELPLVALNFPKFMDGRAYSTASNLRRHFGYEGEIRAIGDVLRDQLFYMRRCGFDTFDLSDSVKPEDARAALSDFADSYQATVEQPEPLFRRRSA